MTVVNRDEDTPDVPTGGFIYKRLLKERIIWLGDEVSQENANAICAQMLLLAAEDPDSDIYLYINSPGGSVTAGMAIYDTMQYVKPDVVTVAMGMAASMGQFLLTAGTKGKRLALPNARVLIHQPAIQGAQGQATDLAIIAEEIDRMRAWLEETLSKHSKRSVEQMHEDIDRDKILTAPQALEYGCL